MNLDSKQDDQTIDFLKYFVRHQQEIYSYILTLVPNVHDADDLFQEGMTVMWRKFDQFELGTNFAAWGIQVMRYMILDYRRKHARSKQVLLGDGVFELLLDHMPRMQDELSERVEALRHCISRLDDRAQRVVKMRYERNIPVTHIASHLSKSPRHVYHILGSINKVLLRCMNKKMAGPQTL